MQPASGGHHTRTFMGMLGGKPSLQMDILDSGFQAGGKTSMMSEIMEEFVLASKEAAYKEPGKQAPMGFMDSGIESHKDGNSSHCADQKQPSFTNSNYSNNTN